MKILKLLPLLVSVCFGAGCATMDDRYQFITKGKVDLDSLVDDKKGLTRAGCAFFFVDTEAGECYEKWHNLGFAERHAHFKSIYTTTRSEWELVRASFLVSLAREKDPGLSLESAHDSVLKMSEEIEKDRACADVNERPLQDTCIILLMRAATDDEVDRAVKKYVTFISPAQAQMEQLMMRTPMHPHLMRPNPADIQRRFPGLPMR